MKACKNFLKEVIKGHHGNEALQCYHELRKCIGFFEIVQMYLALLAWGNYIAPQRMRGYLCDRYWNGKDGELSRFEMVHKYLSRQIRIKEIDDDDDNESFELGQEENSKICYIDFLKCKVQLK